MKKVVADFKIVFILNSAIILNPKPNINLQDNTVEVPMKTIVIT
jgi:hypothetical protein